MWKSTCEISIREVWALLLTIYKTFENFFVVHLLDRHLKMCYTITKFNGLSRRWAKPQKGVQRLPIVNDKPFLWPLNILFGVQHCDQ